MKISGKSCLWCGTGTNDKNYCDGKCQKAHWTHRRSLIRSRLVTLGLVRIGRPRKVK